MGRLNIQRLPSGGMPIVRVTGNYQMTIPAPIRKALGVQAGDYVEVTLSKEGLAQLKPVEMIAKKSKRLKKQNTEEIAWMQLGQEKFLKQYDEKDAAYDKIKL